MHRNWVWWGKSRFTPQNDPGVWVWAPWAKGTTTKERPVDPRKGKALKRSMELQGSLVLEDERRAVSSGKLATRHGRVGAKHTPRTHVRGPERTQTAKVRAKWKFRPVLQLEILAEITGLS